MASIDDRLWGDTFMRKGRCVWCGNALSSREGFCLERADLSVSDRVCSREHAIAYEEHIRSKYPGYKKEDDNKDGIMG